MRKGSCRYLILSLLTFIFTAIAFAQDDEPATPVTPSLDIERLRQATVFILQAQTIGEDLIITCFSSGTIVSRDGLVLTNAHSTVPGESCPGETLIVALNVSPGAPPVPRYRAELVQSNPGLDLALLRINREYDGRLLAQDALALPFVEVADSNSVNLDDTITILGYPGIGNDAVFSQVGTVVAFTAEPSGGAKSWLKSSVSVPASMSGGGAYNRDGELVGIPTTAPIASDLPEATCVTLQDSNDDNLINTDDRCVPVGGEINTLRPTSFALPLIRAARLGIELQDLTQAQSRPLVSRATPSFRRLFFSPSVNEAGMPTQVIRSLPAGSTSLYLFFDYANFTEETVYEMRVTTDGVPNPLFSLSAVRWSGGAEGMWYIGSSGQPYANGVYEFTLLADGIPIETARLVVGGAPEIVPQFSDIIFGVSDPTGESVSSNGYVLPAGNVASAVFIYRDIPAEIPWAQLWYYRGVEIARTETTWVDGTSGAKTISIQEPNGLLPGTYRLELYIDGRLSTSADFTIAGAQEGVLPLAFTNLRFTSADSPAEAATSPRISSFSAGATELYALFDWQTLAAGTPYTIRWLIDGNPFFEQTIPWSQPSSGSGYLYRLGSPQGLPDGTYALEIYLGALRLGRAEARIGIGQLPIDPFALTDNVQMRGQILDAATGEGIPGVSFILISDQFAVADFLASWDMSQVYAFAITDREGRFAVDRPLSFDAPYSVLIVAEGYLPIQADGVIVTTEELPVNLTIYLSRG
jgi:S1-C subfamily serine protease